MTDKEIIENLLTGNQECFKELIDSYQSMVLNTCNSFVHNKDDAHDITQEVFIEVYSSIHSYKQKAKLSTWIYRIAVNKSLNFIRDNKKRNIFRSIENFFSKEYYSELQISDNIDLYKNDDIDNERIELLHNTINSLSRNQKISFTLHKFEKLSYKKIAEVMELSLSAVESLIHRANKNVQKNVLKFYDKKIR